MGQEPDGWNLLEGREGHQVDECEYLAHELSPGYRYFMASDQGHSRAQRTVRCRVLCKKLHRPLGLLAALALLWTLSGIGYARLSDLPEGLLTYVEKKWGREAMPRLRGWQRLMRDNATGSAGVPTDVASLQRVNLFFNQVPFAGDLQHWGVPDYWATPAEMLGSFGGDCEDYSIGKYLSLREIGIPLAKLRITYVRAAGFNESHMVLAYYPSPDADPLILDNLSSTIRPASQRTDLEPVYGFNDDDVWAPSGSVIKGGTTKLRLWRGVLEKLAREQAM